MAGPGHPAADGARAASRLGATYILRSIGVLSKLTDGNVVRALVWLTIIEGNVAHLIGEEGEPYRELDEVPPDDLRRPVSVLAVAHTLGMPYETTRRHVEALIGEGRCLRVKGGVVTPTAVIDADWNREAVTANLANLRRLVRGLRAAGVDLS